MTIHIPRQREDEGKLEFLSLHHVEVKRAHHGPHAPERWRCFCTVCKSWWWAPVPDASAAGWETCLWAAGEHAKWGFWPDQVEHEMTEET